MSFKDNNTDKYVEYNVTYKKIHDYIVKNRINLNNYSESDFDDIGCGLGLTFSRPGGLRENVEFHVPGAWVRQIEGTELAYSYLDSYSKRVKNNEKLPLLVDILNCSHGCNLGTATCKDTHIDDIDYNMNILKEQKLKESVKKKLFSKIYPLFNMFEKDLRLEDFIRRYNDKSIEVNIPDPTNQRLLTWCMKPFIKKMKFLKISIATPAVTEVAKTL
ncbi:MAG: hypothetical protein MZU91_05725 [Desulfosudis oleivorans]|nr:hypothetical protein [Desulfosudis oleivorans]